MNIEKICEQVQILAKETGSFISNERKHFRIDGIEEKGANNYVTYVDKEAEKRLVKGLRKILPEAGFITEEGTAEMNGEKYAWIIDPIDGTSNYIHELPPYCVSIALAQGKELLLGVIYEPSLDECFYAIAGGKAYLNEKEISINRNISYEKAMIAYDMPYRENWISYPLMPILEKLFERASCRQLGTAAIAMAYVACGRFDGYFHFKLSPWDVAAAALIIRQAGGVATDFSGDNDLLFKNTVVCGCPTVYESLKSLICSFK